MLSHDLLWLQYFLISIAILTLLILLLLYILKSASLKKFKPEHVVITGGSSGLGLCIANEVLKTHPAAKITLVARNLEKLKIAQLQFSNHDVGILSLDVSRENSENVTKEMKSLDPDVLICCAGRAEAKIFEEHSLNDFGHLMDLNFFGSLIPIHAVVPLMKKRQNGRIALVSSVAGQFGVFGFSGYSSSKFALTGLAQVLSSELRAHNIGVSICFPPDMDTPGYRAENELGKPWECDEISKMGGFLKPEPLAAKFWKDILQGNFASVCGMDAWASTVATGGWNPPTSYLGMLSEMFLGPIIKFVVWGHIKYFDYIVKKGKQKRMKK